MKEQKENKTLVPVELNLAEHPFFLCGDRNIKEKLIEVGKDKYIEMSCVKGLPTEFDADVLFGLIFLAKEKRYPEKVPFTIHQLAKVLNLPYHNYYQQLVDSIDRLWKTLFKFQGTFYRDGKYISVTQTLDIRLVKSFRLYKHRENRQLPKKYAEKESNLSLDQTIIENIAKKYFRYIDLNQLRSFKDVAKRLFLFYTKHLGDQPEFRIGFDKLCLKIPLETYIVHHQKSRALKILLKAHKSLKEKQIFDYSYDEGRETFTIKPIKKHLKQPKPNKFLSQQEPKQLVVYFKTNCLGETQEQAIQNITNRELENAKRLIEELGWDKAKHVVDYAIQEAPKTNYQMKYFGAVLNYREEALSDLKQKEHQDKQHKQKIKEQQQQQQQMQEEEKHHKELIDKYYALPYKEQEHIKQEAQKNAQKVNPVYANTPLGVEFEIAKIMSKITVAKPPLTREGASKHTLVRQEGKRMF